MKIAVFDESRVGLVIDNHIHDVTRVVPGAGHGDGPDDYVNRMIADWANLRPKLIDESERAAPIPLESALLDASNPAPRQIVAAPTNYRKHMVEMGDLAVTPKGKTAAEQGVFLKAPSSITGSTRGIELPRGSTRRFDHESELAVVIGREARNVGRAQAMDHVFGYTCLIDVTMRIDGTRSEERSMRKSFDTFTPIGPWIVTADEIADPHQLKIELFVNGEKRQSASTSEMIVGIAELIEIASSVMTLWPGDILATGTPEGIGPLAAGDIVAVEIEGIGALRLAVRTSDQQPPWLF
ncbi:fumarylacetoacetate hydrolase family protein [Sphingopyxis indica]|uniref:fumarylacetoacetate hydrolase family protein n=1 Tax=Sphingopyxis indica TaxID=436663 RepID=UPI002938E5C5|nr:fumarylacetoacetate hydrolase family protein [Sphingopyxis indica]WOF42991.1 fumarylacetoacetate hydrolase family protein [Sphingopyxis indica]